MPTLHVTEFTTVARDRGGMPLMAPKFPAQTSQQISYSTSTQSAAFSENTYLLMITAPADCYIKVGENPTADATDCFIAGNVPYFIGVPPQNKIAVYDGSS